MQRAFTQDWLNFFWIVVDCSIFRVQKNNCLIDLYNRDLQTTIVLFTCNVQYATQDWLNNFWITVACYILLFLSLGKQSDKCTWRRLSLAWRNLYKCKQVACGVVVVACLFVYPLFFHTALCCCLFISFPPLCI